MLRRWRALPRRQTSRRRRARDATLSFAAVVLAGQRPGVAHPVAVAAGVPFAVLAPVGGAPMICHVVNALQRSGCVQSGVIVANPELPQASSMLAERVNAAGFGWLPASSGPSASAAAGVAHSGHFPVLITTGDHPLLDATTVQQFCAQVRLSADDFLIAVVRHADVQARLPTTRRTRLAFADGGICSCNLFAVRTPAGVAALRLWQQVEADRKRPWRVIRMLGALSLLRYLTGRLRFASALARLSALAACRIGAVRLADPIMAVDVDTPEDWAQVQQLFNENVKHQAG